MVEEVGGGEGRALGVSSRRRERNLLLSAQAVVGLGLGLRSGGRRRRKVELGLAFSEDADGKAVVGNGDLLGRVEGVDLCLRVCVWVFAELSGFWEGKVLVSVLVGVVMAEEEWRR
ncbi:hypothetical protein CDL15_Pgr022258 [Punica granatum]|nr:hypothetical protein CDL15_Pgr022258 [Punica granatum]